MLFIVYTAETAVHDKTSVSKTIRKPPLAVAQAAIKKKNAAKNDFQYGG